MFLKESTIANVWSKLSTNSTYAFPVKSDSIASNAMAPYLNKVFEYDKKYFIMETWGWARANYSSLTKAGLEQIAVALEIDIAERYDKMDAGDFKSWMVSEIGADKFWFTLNQNPGAKWDGLTDKEKLYITIDDFITKKDRVVTSALSMAALKPFAYLDNDVVGTLGSDWQKGGRVQTKFVADYNFTAETRTLNFGPPTYGKTILVEKVFFDPSIIKSSIDTIKEGNVTLQGSDTAVDASKLVDKIKNEKFGFAGFNFYSVSEPKVFKEWADDLIDAGTTADLLDLSLPDIKYKVSRLTATGQGGLQLSDIETELTTRDFGYTINQCILSAQLYELGEWRKNIRSVRYLAGSGAPYGGRIYCVDTKNPNVMMNWLVQPKSMNDLVTKTSYTDWTKKYGYYFQLFKIEEDDKGSSKKYEYKFETKEGTTTLNDIRLKSRDFENNKDDLSSKVFGDVAGNIGAEKILIENVEISIAGETIA